MTLGREPIRIVEIDVDQCTLTYGGAPCTAALSASTPAKCFNMYRHCQDQVNFAPGTLTLRFAENISGLPKTGTFFPALRSVSSRAAEINLSGIDPRTSALGKRARVTVKLQDFVYHDRLTDKYSDERASGAAQFSGVGYDPARGTFFGKLRARWPFYLGRALRVREGYVGQTVAQMAVAHYVISEWHGPNAAGEVTIIAKDVLDLVDGSRALAPAASTGKIVADIAAADTAATLEPAGVGNSDYPASGRVAIGREVATFTRSGDDLTLTARGVDGTEADSHKAGDVAQLCLRYEGQRGTGIIDDLLTVQGPVDTAFVDLPTWNSDYDDWTSGLTFTATITKPTPISQLVGELCQHGFYVWWDEIGQAVRFRANRPKEPGETYAQLNDAASLVEGSVDVAAAQDQRLTTLIFWHGMLDPTDSVTDARNYRAAAVVVDASAGFTNEHGEHRIKEIFSRWFGEAGNDAAASVIAERLVSRFRDTPRVLTAVLDVKDAGLELADLVQVTSRFLQDETGLDGTLPMQIGMRERAGDRLKIRAESGVPSARFGFWMNAPAPGYDSATALEKEEGAFWFDDALADFGDGTGPYVWF